MIYPEINEFMLYHGLDREPAFDFLHFVTEPIPPEQNRIILGLYYPEGEHARSAAGYLPPSTIILPQDCTIDTLLHELGHRYGDYYYGDISEKFAEEYRIKFPTPPSPPRYAQVSSSNNLALPVALLSLLGITVALSSRRKSR